MTPGEPPQSPMFSPPKLSAQPIGATDFLSSGPQSPNLLRDDSITHGSSELMLVLYPEDGRLRSGMELCKCLPQWALPLLL